MAIVCKQSFPWREGGGHTSKTNFGGFKYILVLFLVVYHYAVVICLYMCKYVGIHEEIHELMS